MTAIAARVEHAIGTVRERFLQGLPARLDAIAVALEHPGARVIERGFHSLAGTAATYALFGIAGVASEGEHLCVRAGDFLDDTTRVRLHKLVEHLRAVAMRWQARVAC